ncbi:MAG TPA: acylphosphatase [Nocardioides sp.]|nr:acylphosphatase [Nocardioides sp.]
MDRKAVDVVITGRVQGVFFRARAHEQADRLGVAGWVANEPDGSVAGHFEGAAADVDALVDWCRSGPEYARVDDVRVSAAEAEGSRGFDVRG